MVFGDIRPNYSAEYRIFGRIIFGRIIRYSACFFAEYSVFGRIVKGIFGASLFKSYDRFRKEGHEGRTPIFLDFPYVLYKAKWNKKLPKSGFLS